MALSRWEIPAERAYTLLDMPAKAAASGDPEMWALIKADVEAREVSAEAWAKRAAPNLEASCRELYGRSFRSCAVVTECQDGR